MLCWLNLLLKGPQFSGSWQTTSGIQGQGMMGQPVGNYGLQQQPQPFMSNPTTMGMMTGQGMNFSYGMMGYQSVQGRMGNGGAPTQATL